MKLIKYDEGENDDTYANCSLMIVNRVWCAAVEACALVLAKIEAGNVPVDVEQPCLIKFLVKENGKLAESLRRTHV